MPDRPDRRESALGRSELGHEETCSPAVASRPFGGSAPIALALREGFGEPNPLGPRRLLARGVDGDLGAAAGCGASPGSADGSHLPPPQKN